MPAIGALGFGAQRLMPLLQMIYAGWMAAVTDQASLRDVLELATSSKCLPESIKELSFEREVRLERVGFSYPNRRERFVLQSVSLVIPKGECVGISGRTGTGKSTLVDLLMGLLVPTVGEIIVDDQILTARNLSIWRKKIAHVPQSIYLSDASIAENIAFGYDIREIDPVRVREVAAVAQIAQEIERLPEGYETLVGERGIRLSGGQRQRIGIARALYRKAELLVLDEATSALDLETEGRVMQSINEYCPDLTKIIISHRQDTLRYCDIRVNLDCGMLMTN